MSNQIRQVTDSAEKTDPRTAFVYLRATAGPQASHASEDSALGRQRAACQSVGKALGVTVEGEFIDAGQSGRKGDRPGMRELLLAIAKRAPTYLIVSDRSRLKRNMGDSLELETRLADAYVVVATHGEYSDEWLDLAPFGQVLLHFSAAGAKEEPR